VSRPRCDPFDAAAIRAAIANGEASERAAYLAYASTAARPYARSTFTIMLRQRPTLARPRPRSGGPIGREDPRALSSTPGTPPDRSPGAGGSARKAGPVDWRERLPVKPRILSLAAGGGVRVHRAALVAFDVQGLSVRYTPASQPPSAIVLASTGGFVSIEAVRWCARRSVAGIVLDRAHGFLTVMTGAPKASARRLRAQVEADPVPIARAIVAAKIEGLSRVGGLDPHEAGRALTNLREAGGVEAIRNIEAQASRIAWGAPIALAFDRGPVPADWLAPWLARGRLDTRTKQRARHPVNAMLNAAFAVTAGRLAAYLAAAGFSPAIGFLHADKPGRWSLAWDAIEPLRPMIEARLFRLCASERFLATDFERETEGALRLAGPCLRLVLNEAAPSAATLSRCVKRMVGLIETRSKGVSSNGPLELILRGDAPRRTHPAIQGSDNRI
jgi:CRISP-associated protein Cas1